MEGQTIVEIEFAELSDGSLVEMIEDPANPTQALLAVYHNGLVRYAKSIGDGGRLLAPLSRTEQSVLHVRFPQGAEPYGQLLELQQSVCTILQVCLDLKADSVLLMMAWLFSTWFARKLPVAPYLALVGPPGSGKTTAMRVLGLLSYRSLLTADITSPAFYEISHRIHPTIFIDEMMTARHTRDLIHLLKVSSTPDFVSLRKGSVRLAYGPKAFSLLELPADLAQNSRCVAIPMHRTSRTDLRHVDDPELLEAAKRIRKKLLQFRFERYQTVSLPEIPTTVKLSGRPLDLYGALALAFQGDQATCDVLGKCIVHQEEIQAPPLSSAQMSAMRVLYDVIHRRPNADGYSLSVLTDDVNLDLEIRGEPCELNERKLGNVFSSLYFTKRARKNSGYFLLLERSDREQIHKIAHDYGISEGPIENCGFCTHTGVPAATKAAAEAPGEKNAPAGEEKGEVNAPATMLPQAKTAPKLQRGKAPFGKEKGERRARRERQIRGGAPLQAPASKQVRSPRS